MLKAPGIAAMERDFRRAFAKCGAASPHGVALQEFVCGVTTAVGG